MTILEPTLATGFVAFTVVAVLSAVMRWVALRSRLIDRPRPGRVHTSATPYLGGVAIAVGTLGTAVVIAYPLTHGLLVIICAGALVALLGLADDLWSLSPATKLIIECLVATGLVAAGLHVEFFAGVPIVGSWIDGAGTVCWVVVITNSFNLLDNTDGVAAAVAFVTTPVLAVLAFAVGQPGLAILLIAMCAGCAGFLIHNWTPAQIFMGDAGSLFIGLIISSAVLACVSGYANRPSVSAVSCGLILMTFVATIDTFTVLVSRLRAGRRWSEGGTDHIAHRLRTAGLSTSRAATVLALASAVSVTIGVMVVTGVMGAWQSLGVTLAVGAILVAVAQKIDVYQRQVSHPGNYLQRGENVSFARRHFRHNSVGPERADHPVHPVA